MREDQFKYGNGTVTVKENLEEKEKVMEIDPVKEVMRCEVIEKRCLEMQIP